MKNRIALAFTALLAAVCGPAHAQASVTIYGVADAGVEYQKASAGAGGPATSSKNLVNGTFGASRLGFRGSDDLGGGLRAFFQLEHGFNIDDGTVTGAAFWGRKAIVGLSGSWGEISLGRDYSPGFWVQFYTDVNAFAMYGNSGTMSAFALTGMLRTSNGIYYVSPEINGFRGRLTYSLGDESTTAPKDAGRVIGLSGEYRSPTLSAGVFHQERKSVFPASGTSSQTNVYQGVTGLYNIGQWAVSGGLARFDPAGPNTATSGVVKSLWGGVIYRLGSSDVRVNVGHVTTDLTAPTKGKSTLIGVNYSYYQSKTTNLYVDAGRVSNNASSQFGLEGGSRAIPNRGLGSDTTAMGAGIRTTF
ncbi:MAG TPA: porin [Ideonella sp.]|nr:porin [Ideonella sp.]